MPVFYALKASKLQNLIEGKDNERVVNGFGYAGYFMDMCFGIRRH
jgi:hypothetical protein